VYRTRAAERRPTAELCTRQAQNIVQIPKHRHLRISIKLAFDSINFEKNGHLISTAAQTEPDG
jgi:hypothetical protein